MVRNNSTDKEALAIGNLNSHYSKTETLNGNLQILTLEFLWSYLKVLSKSFTNLWETQVNFCQFLKDRRWSKAKWNDNILQLAAMTYNDNRLPLAAMTMCGSTKDIYCWREHSSKWLRVLNNYHVHTLTNRPTNCLNPFSHMPHGGQGFNKHTCILMMLPITNSLHASSFMKIYFSKPLRNYLLYMLVVNAFLILLYTCIC